MACWLIKSNSVMLSQHFFLLVFIFIFYVNIYKIVIGASVGRYRSRPRFKPISSKPQFVYSNLCDASPPTILLFVTMSSTSKPKSYRRKRKLIPKPKQRWQVKQPVRNWLELPSDLMVNILQRVGVVGILENAQKVCTAWREICKDPAMWRVIHLDKFSDLRGKSVFREMCKHAVDRSHGQLVDLTMIGFCNYELLQYVADRSSQLRCLEIIPYFHEVHETLSEPLKKLSLLEELSFVRTNISQQDVEAAGCFCPLLKTLKVNQKAIRSWDDEDDYDESMIIENGIALAIGKNLPGL
ncbi:hypothetical protein L1987_87444 [Smallanthus sonchifolius]|nr:hypothetical protein L1987_87444 [Smallanthus sonchifolius]